MFKRSWLGVALRVKGSVLPAVLPRSIVCGLVTAAIVLLAQQNIKLFVPLKDNLIPSIVLGLLLVFRTNTAYDRYWEGRKALGTIIVSIRNLSRQIWVHTAEKSPLDREKKRTVLNLLAAIPYVTKHHLRGEPMGKEVQKLLSESRWQQLQQSQQSSNVPLEVVFWISDYLQREYRSGHLNVNQLVAMTNMLDAIVGAIAGCERILKTPIPLAYAIHLKQLLLIYCLFLPFQTVKDLGWMAVPVVSIVSFTLLGIEEIGVEIENPFGTDSNDLPLDTICETVLGNVEDLMRLSPESMD
jgi:ion channel-forming bestrophin family protein